MAASGGSDSDKNRKDAELSIKDEKSDAAGGGSGAAAANGSGGASGGGGGSSSAAAAAAAAAAPAAAAAVAKERDYIWSEDAVHVLLDHFLEKYMSYEKGMIRNADWVEIAARVNQQLDGNKPVKTPEQCKNKVDNLKKQYRKERRRGSLGPSSTNWSFFSRMHDIFESDYKKAGGSGGGGSGEASAAAAAAADDDEPPPPPPPPPPPAAVAVVKQRPAVPDHYLASREFARKDDLFNKRQQQYSPPPPPPQQQQQQPTPAPLMLLPDHHHHHHHHRDRDREREREREHHHHGETPARKKVKASAGAGDHHHHQQQQQQQQQRHFDQGSGAPSSDSGGGGGGGGGAGGGGGGGGSGDRSSSKLERKLQRHQLAALRRDFMEGFTGFAEVMLKIEVAKMEMQRDLERQRAEMELHRTQMMLSNQLQLAKYLKSSPLAAAAASGGVEAATAAAAGGAGATGTGFWPNFGFADNGGTGTGPAAGPGVGAGANSSNAAANSSSSGAGGNRLQLAIPIFPGFTALDAVGPYEVLHMLPNVEVLFVSHEPGLYTAGMGMLTLQATASFDQVPRPQILVVPGGSGTRRLLQDRPILDWIRKVHEHTLYTASVCTGSLLLGAAGLLRGVEATTHWNSHEMLADFGAKPISSRIVRQGKIITAAGVSAGIDMALQLAALLTDEATAKMLQLYIEYDPQPPFDTGNVSKAGPELISRAKELSKLRQQAAAATAAATAAPAAPAAVV